MKTIMTFTLAFICTMFLGAQTVPNSGFEAWTDGEPDEWTTNNLEISTTISQSDDSNSGTYAVRGQVVERGGDNLGPLLVSGYNDLGIPVSEKYDQCSFYYNCIILCHIPQCTNCYQWWLRSVD